MSLTRNQVDHVARLARLELDESEKEQYTKDLNNILGYMEKLTELNIEGVEPTAHAAPLTNVFRDDKISPSMNSEDALANAPRREGSFFRVPKILEEE